MNPGNINFPLASMTDASGGAAISAPDPRDRFTLAIDIRQIGIFRGDDLTVPD